MVFSAVRPRGLTYQWARRIAIGLVGGSVLLVGIAMTVLPGPALLVIPAGLGILGLEFAWARRWLKTVRDRATHWVNGHRGPRTGLPVPVDEPRADAS